MAKEALIRIEPEVSEDSRLPEPQEPSPQKKPEFASVKRGYADILVTLAAASVMPFYLYGVQTAILLAAAIGTAIVTEWVCLRLRGAHREKGDYSCLVTAVITALLLPATAPLWMAVLSVVISLSIAKHPFGGTGYNIFNPAAVGVAFCAICWPETVMRYPTAFSTYRFLNPGVLQYGTSPASVLRVGGTPKIDYFDLLLGKYPGPMGGTCMLVLLCCLFYLLVRRRASLAVALTSFSVVGVSALLFPRLVTGPLNSAVYELSSGAFVFGVTFMANDPATVPKTRGGRIFYGALIGLSVVCLRRFGEMELEFVYAILMANIFASSCDRYARRIAGWWDRIRELPRRRAAARKRVKERTRQRRLEAKAEVIPAAAPKTKSRSGTRSRPKAGPKAKRASGPETPGPSGKTDPGAAGTPRPQTDASPEGGTRDA